MAWEETLSKTLSRPGCVSAGVSVGDYLNYLVDG